MKWRRVDLGNIDAVTDGADPYRFVPYAVQLSIADFETAAIPTKRHPEREPFRSNALLVDLPSSVADAVTLWNNASRDIVIKFGNLSKGPAAFGGITRAQFIEEFLKPAFAADLVAHQKARKKKRLR